MFDKNQIVHYSNLDEIKMHVGCGKLNTEDVEENRLGRVLDSAKAAEISDEITPGELGVHDVGRPDFEVIFKQSLKHAMQDLGVQTMGQLRTNLYSGRTRFELRSPSAQAEGKVHDLLNVQR